MYTHTCIYIYLSMCIYVYMCIYIYMFFVTVKQARGSETLEAEWRFGFFGDARPDQASRGSAFSLSLYIYTYTYIKL